MNIDIQRLSKDYNVRTILSDDLEDVYQLCLGNPLYYQYCPPEVTKESIKRDLETFPPSMSSSDKYYLGFYQSGKLVGVIDLIFGYPEASVAFIGFFMTHRDVQNQGIGTSIIQQVCICFRELGFQSVRLAWIKGNPQAEHFWTKNQFMKIEEARNDAGVVIVAERLL